MWKQIIGMVLGVAIIGVFIWLLVVTY